MGTFACIEFSRDKILLSKVSYEEMSYLGKEGYHVYLTKPIEEMMRKEWQLLEQNLLNLNVEYIVMASRENPFDELIKVDGELMKYYLASYLLKYIYKYRLLPKDSLYTHIGIIPGKIDETLAVVSSIMHEITALTFYVETPESYQMLLRDIYKQSRLSAKAKIPCSISLREADIIFDLSGQKNYAKWCKPSAIYMDLKNTIEKKDITFEHAPPSIWNDFDIVCEGQLIKPDILEAVLHAQGIYKRNYLVALKRMRASIHTVYHSRIS